MRRLIGAQSKTHGFWKDNRFAIILLGLVCVATFAIVAYIITSDKTTVDQNGKPTVIANPEPQMYTPTPPANLVPAEPISGDGVIVKGVRKVYGKRHVDQNGKPTVIANPELQVYTPTPPANFQPSSKTRPLPAEPISDDGVIVHDFDNFVKEVLNANGLEVPTGCRSKGSKPEGGRDYTGPTTLYTACRIQCPAGSFLTTPFSRNRPDGRFPFNDVLLVGFDENGALGAYTDVPPYGHPIDVNKLKCARITDTRVEPIDTTHMTTDCISLFHVHEALHGNFKQTTVGRSVAYVYEDWICLNADDEPLTYKFEISFDYGASYHIIGGFVGFRENKEEEKNLWISEPFYLPVSGDANHRLNLVRGYARKHFTNNVVPDDINKLISTYVSTTDVTTALKQLDEVHARLVAKHKEAKVFKIKK
eukprot:762937_1